MNSKQRRKDARLWKYKVFTNSVTFDQYSDMWNWLDKKHGRLIMKCGWRERMYEDEFVFDLYDITWEFIKKSHAIEFALKWA